MIFIFLVLFLILPIALSIRALPIIAPTFIMLYGIHRKKKKVVVIALIVLVIFILFIILFPISFPYANLWIYGKTSEEIINVYGKPDINRKDTIAYYIGEDNGVLGTGLFDSNVGRYYYICFDEDGYAREIDVSGPPGG